MSDVKKPQKPSSPKKKDSDSPDTPAPAQVTIDPRCGWFEDKVLAALKIKGDKWRKFTSAPENLYLFTHSSEPLLTDLFPFKLAKFTSNLARTENLSLNSWMMLVAMP
jgi:hypothetical protein